MSAAWHRVHCLGISSGARKCRLINHEGRTTSALSGVTEGECSSGDTCHGNESVCLSGEKNARTGHKKEPIMRRTSCAERAWPCARSDVSPCEHHRFCVRHASCVRYEYLLHESMAARYTAVSVWGFFFCSRDKAGPNALEKRSNTLVNVYRATEASAGQSVESARKTLACSQVLNEAL